jgi:predicted permease
MNDFWREFKDGVRCLARRPGFSVVGVLTLGMGIGANTAIFSLVNGVLLRPLPYREPEQLVRLFETNLAKGGSREMTSVSNLEDWRKQAVLFTGLAAWQRPTTITLTSETPAVELRASVVSANFFAVLGVNAAQGRTFGDAEEAETPMRTVLISDGFWRRQLGGRPAVVGSSVQIETRDFTVIGVLPANFVNPAGEADVWLKAQMRPDDSDRGQTYLQVLARLKPGVTPAQAQAELDNVASRLAAAFPSSNRGRGIMAAPLMDEVVGEVRRPLFLVLGAVGLLLLIACANAANLFLLRNTERRGEIAVRVALGATPRDVLVLALGSGARLSLIGIAAGLVGSLAVTQAIESVLFEVEATDPVTFVAVSAFLLAATVGATWAPARRAARIDPSAVLRER